MMIFRQESACGTLADVPKAEMIRAGHKGPMSISRAFENLVSTDGCRVLSKERTVLLANAA